MGSNGECRLASWGSKGCLVILGTFSSLNRMRTATIEGSDIWRHACPSRLLRYALGCSQLHRMGKRHAGHYFLSRDLLRRRETRVQAVFNSPLFRACIRPAYSFVNSLVCWIDSGAVFFFFCSEWLCCSPRLEEHFVCAAY